MLLENYLPLKQPITIYNQFKRLQLALVKVYYYSFLQYLGTAKEYLCISLIRRKYL